MKASEFIAKLKEAAMSQVEAIGSGTVDKVLDRTVDKGVNALFDKLVAAGKCTAEEVAPVKAAFDAFTDELAVLVPKLIKDEAEGV